MSQATCVTKPQAVIAVATLIDRRRKAIKKIGVTKPQAVIAVATYEQTVKELEDAYVTKPQAVIAVATYLSQYTTNLMVGYKTASGNRCCNAKPFEPSPNILNVTKPQAVIAVATCLHSHRPWLCQQLQNRKR